MRLLYWSSRKFYSLLVGWVVLVVIEKILGILQALVVISDSKVLLSG